jgi:mono/diheme cytochrome c family protein
MRALIVAALAFFCACVPPAPEVPTTEQLAARGQYLVLAIGGCNDCHTPMTPQGPDMARALQGAPLAMVPTIEMPWAPIAPPIAGIPANFTDEQFTAFLQTGDRPDGSHALPPMPQYRLNDDDARAVAAYVKSLPPAP